MSTHTPEEHRDMLLASFPPGIAFPREPNSVRGMNMLAYGDNLARVEAAAVTMAVAENDPRTADAMLPEWEELTGVDPTLDAGVAVVLIMARIRAQGGQAVQYFIDLAAAMGFAITITQNRPLRCDAHCGDRFGGIAWEFVWDVNAPIAAEGSSLETIFRRFSPGHTLVRFFYS